MWLHCPLLAVVFLPLSGSVRPNWQSKSNTRAVFVQGMGLALVTRTYKHTHSHTHLPKNRGLLWTWFTWVHPSVTFYTSISFLSFSNASCFLIWHFNFFFLFFFVHVSVFYLSNSTNSILYHPFFFPSSLKAVRKIWSHWGLFVDDTCCLRISTHPFVKWPVLFWTSWISGPVLIKLPTVEF